MSRLTRAVIGAAVLAVAAPAAADAATLQVDVSKTQQPFRFQYLATPGEANDVRISEAADGSTIISDSAPIRISGGSSLDGCRLEADGDAVCAPGLPPFAIKLGDGNDTIRYLASKSFANGIDAGAGNDTVFAGIRRNGQGALTLIGGSGTADKVTYASAAFPATVSLDNQANDGVRGDAQNVRPDFEIVEGSAFGDTITGSDADERERYVGGNGDDTIAGLGGSDVFHEGSAPNGADTYNGGSGIDLVDYSQRTRHVDVSLDLARNDGETGEADFVDPNVNDVFGGAAGDTLTGSNGPNTLVGKGGGDTMLGLGGDDTIDSIDNTPDTIRCGAGVADTLNRDLQDVDAEDCEVVNSVGRLSLAPRSLTAKAGAVAVLRLRWTHPHSWKQLRAVSVRLRAGSKPAGRIVIRPRGGSVSAQGVTVVRKRTRLSHRGRAVTARLAIRFNARHAGRTLKADIAATDVRGARQVVRGAATIRVSGGPRTR
jgi:hypothetical protein